MPYFRYTTLILSTLAMLGSFPVFGNQEGSDALADTDVTEAPIETKIVDEAAEDDGKPWKKWFKKKPKDPNRGRFLPIPIFITEPAIGDGLGLALTYFHRTKEVPEKKNIASPNSIIEASNDQAPPPTVTGVVGAYTSNKTAAAGVGHMNTFKDDHIRFTGFAAWADVNSTFYLLNQPLKFNLEGAVIYGETRFRIADSKWFLGVGLSYLDARSAFRVELPDDAPIELFPSDLNNAGLAAKLAWDTRDNTSMPNSGQLFDLAVWRYDNSFGGDYDYWEAKVKMLSFHQLHERFVLGLRLEYSTINGEAPFFAVPWISLRGIPALRYQGDRVLVAEVEGRYNFTPRWAMVGFAGSGATSSDSPVIDDGQSIYAYGLGGRFRIFEAQNVWVGIDIARGPEETNWYIQVGQAW